MRALRAAWLAALLPVLCAQSASVNDLVAAQRKIIESADLRATGHLVSIGAGGARVSFPITIKAYSLPGVLRERVDIGQPPSARQDMREHILLEMRPNGENAIRVANPGDKTPRLVPFEKWSADPLGPGFSYEDFLEQQYFWPGQTAEGMEKRGARDCEVVKSTPSAADRTQYSEVKTWIDPSIGFAVYVEKTEKESGAVKEFTSFGIRHDEGVWSAHQTEVKTRGQEGSTLLIIDRGTIKAHLTIADFNPAQLIEF
jgi:hypothetical protein